MKKIYYTNTRYQALVKFMHENGALEWLRSSNLNLAEAKRMYTSVHANIGAKAHKIGNTWFYGHMKGEKNGTIEYILIEEVKPIYFM